MALAAAGWWKQNVRIDWVVLDPSGQRVGTVSQNNNVPKGSLDGPWGAIADTAAGAAADGIVKLFAKQAHQYTPAESNISQVVYTGIYSGSVHDTSGTAANVQFKLARNGTTAWGSYLRDGIYGNVDGEVRGNCASSSVGNGPAIQDAA